MVLKPLAFTFISVWLLFSTTGRRIFSAINRLLRKAGEQIHALCLTIPPSLCWAAASVNAQQRCSPLACNLARTFQFPHAQLPCARQGLVWAYKKELLKFLLIILWTIVQCVAKWTNKAALKNRSQLLQHKKTKWAKWCTIMITALTENKP